MHLSKYDDNQASERPIAIYTYALRKLHELLPIIITSASHIILISNSNHQDNFIHISSGALYHTYTKYAICSALCVLPIAVLRTIHTHTHIISDVSNYIQWISIKQHIHTQKIGTHEERMQSNSCSIISHWLYTNSKNPPEQIICISFYE